MPSLHSPVKVSFEAHHIHRAYPQAREHGDMRRVEGGKARGGDRPVSATFCRVQPARAIWIRKPRTTMSPCAAYKTFRQFYQQDSGTARESTRSGSRLSVLHLAKVRAIVLISLIAHLRPFPLALAPKFGGDYFQHEAQMLVPQLLKLLATGRELRSGNFGLRLDPAVAHPTPSRSFANRRQIPTDQRTTYSQCCPRMGREAVSYSRSHSYGYGRNRDAHGTYRCRPGGWCVLLHSTTTSYLTSPRTSDLR